LIIKLDFMNLLLYITYSSWSIYFWRIFMSPKKSKELVDGIIDFLLGFGPLIVGLTIFALCAK